MQLATKNDAINIAIVRGHSKLNDTCNNEVGGTRVFAGVLKDSPNSADLKAHMADQFFSNDKHLGKKYHTYSAIWKNDSITFKLNGKTYAVFDHEETMAQIDMHEEVINLNCASKLV